MDLSTVIGLILCVVSIIAGILMGSSLNIFIDIPSVFMVFIPVVGATMVKWPIEVVKNLFVVGLKSIIYIPADPKLAIDEIGNLAETARRESVFALEKVQVEDPFLKKAMTLAADNRPPEVISAILNLEIDAMEVRHKTGVEVLDGIGSDGPAMGMIGTLIGLVQMLQNLSDPSAIGPAMAVALLTTFYGSVIANVFALPLKNKVSVRSKMEILKMNIIVAGTLGIVAGENPRLIKEKLNAFLPTADRMTSEDDRKE